MHAKLMYLINRNFSTINNSGKCAKLRAQLQLLETVLTNRKYE